MDPTRGSKLRNSGRTAQSPNDSGLPRQCEYPHSVFRRSYQRTHWRNALRARRRANRDRRHTLEIGKQRRIHGAQVWRSSRLPYLAIRARSGERPTELGRWSNPVGGKCPIHRLGRGEPGRRISAARLRPTHTTRFPKPIGGQGSKVRCHAAAECSTG